MIKKIEIKLNPLQVAALAMAYKRDVITIRRWAKKNHIALQTPAALDIINKFNDPQLPKLVF